MINEMKKAKFDRARFDAVGEHLEYLANGDLIWTKRPYRNKSVTDAEVGAVMNEVERTCEYGHHHFGYWLAVARATEAETLRRVREVNNG